MNNTATREELKAILDEWIPKYIRQVVELRSGSRLSAERYNELMNLLITQGDDTIELAETVKQYMELLVEDMSAEFEATTELANTAVSTANNAVTTINQYKTTIDNDIAEFKAAVTQATDTANSNAALALQTANQLVTDMSAYRNELTQDINDTFEIIRADLGAQVTDEVLTQMQGIQEALTADINSTINALSEDVMTIANTAEQTVNSAVQDIEAYKADMDVRLDAALKEVEDSLSVAGDIIQDASAIYEAINGMQETVDGFEDRLGAVEEFVENADFANSEHTHTKSEVTDFEHTHTKSEITDFPTSMPASDVSSWAKEANKPTYTKSEVGLSNVPNVATNDQTPTFSVASSRANIVSGEKLSVILGKIMKFFADLKTVAFSGSYTDLSNKPTSLPASDVSAWAKASAKPTYTWSEITSKPSSFTPASHNQAASTVTAGTLAGKVQANATAAATVTNAQVRDIYAGTSDMTAGTTALTSGTIYIMYE